MTELHETEAGLSADLAARLWAMEHVLETLMVISLRLDSDTATDMLERAKSYVDHGRHAGHIWAWDHGYKLGDNPEMESLASKHAERLFRNAYRRLDGGLRRIGGEDVGDPGLAGDNAGES